MTEGTHKSKNSDIKSVRTWFLTLLFLVLCKPLIQLCTLAILSIILCIGVYTCFAIVLCVYDSNRLYCNILLYILK